MAANSAGQEGLTPEQAVDRLEELHTAASTALREALSRFTETGAVPTAEERLKFRYPELSVDWRPSGAVHFTRRAWAKFQAPGLYSTTITQPTFFRQYLLEQLRPLAEEFNARIEVGDSDQEIPYPSSRRRATSSSTASSRSPSWRVIFQQPSLPMSATRSSTAFGNSRTGGRGRWRCSTPCASTTRCGG